MHDFLAVPGLLLGDLMPYAVLGGAGWLVWRAVRAYERHAVSALRLRALAERVRALESALDRVERNATLASESQRLAATLLAARGVLRPDPHD